MLLCWIQSQVYPAAQVESCCKVQATVGCLWRTLQTQISILDRSDSDGATDCHCDIFLHFRRIGCHQCFHHHYTVVVGILTFWSFTKGVYKKKYLSTIEAFYLLNIFLLSAVSLATASLGSRDYQIATIVSVCLSFVVCLVTVALHLSGLT